MNRLRYAVETTSCKGTFVNLNSILYGAWAPFWLWELFFVIISDRLDLIRFKLEERTIVSHLFHQWAKKQAFQHPKRLLDKVLSLVAVRKLQVCTLICWANYIIT